MTTDSRCLAAEASVAASSSPDAGSIVARGTTPSIDSVVTIRTVRRAPLSPRDALEHLGQFRPGHHAVLDVVVGGDAPHRRERALAALPDPRAVLLALRHLHGRCAGAMTDRFHFRELLAHFGDRPVELDDQDGL